MPGPTVGDGVTVPVGVPVARARAVAVTHAALTVLAALLPAAVMVPLAVVDAAFTVGATCVAALATLLPAALIVGARLVARPATVLTAEFTVGAALVAAPAADVTAALTVGAALVAAPVTVVAAALVVAVAPELLQATRIGNRPRSIKPHNRPIFHRKPVIAFSFTRLPQIPQSGSFLAQLMPTARDKRATSFSRREREWIAHAILTPMREDDVTIAAVCVAFGIGAPVAAERVRAGYLNHDEAVTLADGRRFFLKGSRHGDPRVVAAEHAVVRHAAAHGLPTPLPLVTAGGRSVVVVEGTPWSAYPFITGETLRGPETARTLGRLLAETHRALASCPTTGLTFAEGPLDWSTTATIAEMTTIEEHIAAREAADTADAFDTFTRAAFDALRQILRDASPPDAFAWLPRQVIHGDFYPPNLLCDLPGMPIAVLDWEFATVRPRVWDVVRAIAFTFLGVHDDPPDVAAARSCVAAYRAIVPLPDDELAAGIALYLWRTAHNLAKYRWHDQHGPQPTDALAPGDLALVRWLHEHGEAFARYLAGGPIPPPALPMISVAKDAPTPPD